MFFFVFVGLSLIVKWAIGTSVPAMEVFSDLIMTFCMTSEAVRVSRELPTLKLRASSPLKID